MGISQTEGTYTNVVCYVFFSFPFFQEFFKEETGVELLAITAGDDPDDVPEPKVRSVITTNTSRRLRPSSSIL